MLIQQNLVESPKKNKISSLNPLVPNAIFFIQFQNPFKDSFVWVKTEFHFFYDK